jgi:hypothetical protein
MRITQKFSYLQTSFDFGDDELTYSFTDSRRKVGTSIRYSKISEQILYVKAKRWAFLYVPVFCAGVYLILGIYSLLVVKDVLFLYEAPILLTVFPLMFMLYRLSNKPIGTFIIRTHSATNLPIQILDDKKHSAILNEIEKRRKEQIRQEFAQVDFNKPYYEELKKFNWLKEQEIISEQEYQQARQKIAIMRGNTSPPPPGEIRMN